LIVAEVVTAITGDNLTQLLAEKSNLYHTKKTIYGLDRAHEHLSYYSVL